MSSTFFERVLANSVNQNMLYEKLNLFSILHSTFYILHSVTYKSRDFPQFPLTNLYKILYTRRGYVYVLVPQKLKPKIKVKVI